MFEPQAGARAGFRLQGDRDPAHRSAGALPGDGDAPRRLAGGDLAARIALELIAAAQTQVAGDWQEPARNPFGIGQGVPEVFGRGVIGAAGDHHPGRLAAVFEGPNLADHQASVAQDVVHAASGGSSRFR